MGKIREKKPSTSTSLKLVIHRKDVYIGAAIVVAITLIIAFQALMFPIPKQTQKVGVELFIDSNATTVYAGYSMSNGSLGNNEGFNPGMVVEYVLPANINPGKLVLVGQWRNDPLAMIHVGGGQGFAFFGFQSAENVSMVASSPEPAKVLVFFDNGYVPKDVAGNDVEVQDGRSSLVVHQEKVYHLIQNMPKGAHMVSIATKVENVSLKWISIK